MQIPIPTAAIPTTKPRGSHHSGKLKSWRVFLSSFLWPFSPHFRLYRLLLFLCGFMLALILVGNYFRFRRIIHFGYANSNPNNRHTAENDNGGDDDDGSFEPDDNLSGVGVNSPAPSHEVPSPQHSKEGTNNKQHQTVNKHQRDQNLKQHQLSNAPTPSGGHRRPQQALAIDLAKKLLLLHKSDEEVFSCLEQQNNKNGHHQQQKNVGEECFQVPHIPVYILVVQPHQKEEVLIPTLQKLASATTAYPLDNKTLHDQKNIEAGEEGEEAQKQKEKEKVNPSSHHHSVLFTIGKLVLVQQSTHVKQSHHQNFLKILEKHLAHPSFFLYLDFTAQKNIGLASAWNAGIRYGSDLVIMDHVKEGENGNDGGHQKEKWNAILSHSFTSSSSSSQNQEDDNHHRHSFYFFNPKEIPLFYFVHNANLRFVRIHVIADVVREVFEKIIMRRPTLSSPSPSLFLMHGFNLFAVTSEAILSRVGFFDEVVYPQFAEDIEYLLRMKILRETIVDLGPRISTHGPNLVDVELHTPPIEVEPLFHQGVDRWGREEYLFRKWGFDMSSGGSDMDHCTRCLSTPYDLLSSASMVRREDDEDDQERKKKVESSRDGFPSSLRFLDWMEFMKTGEMIMQNTFGAEMESHTTIDDQKGGRKKNGNVNNHHPSALLLQKVKNALSSLRIKLLSGLVDPKHQDCIMKKQYSASSSSLQFQYYIGCHQGQCFYNVTQGIETQLNPFENRLLLRLMKGGEKTSTSISTPSTFGGKNQQNIRLDQNEPTRRERDSGPGISRFLSSAHMQFAVTSTCYQRRGLFDQLKRFAFTPLPIVEKSNSPEIKEGSTSSLDRHFCFAVTAAAGKQKDKEEEEEEEELIGLSQSLFYHLSPVTGDICLVGGENIPSSISNNERERNSGKKRGRESEKEEDVLRSMITTIPQLAVIFDAQRNSIANVEKCLDSIFNRGNLRSQHLIFVLSGCTTEECVYLSSVLQNLVSLEEQMGVEEEGGNFEEEEEKNSGQQKTTTRNKKQHHHDVRKAIRRRLSLHTFTEQLGRSISWNTVLREHLHQLGDWVWIIPAELDLLTPWQPSDNMPHQYFAKTGSGAPPVENDNPSVSNYHWFVRENQRDAKSFLIRQFGDVHVVGLMRSIAISFLCVEKVGFFDENFWPFYGEEMEYFVRLAVLRLPFSAYPWSYTLQGLPSHPGQGHMAIEEYLFRKWNFYISPDGGIKAEDQTHGALFLHPFNISRFEVVKDSHRLLEPLHRDCLRSNQTEPIQALYPCVSQCPFFVDNLRQYLPPPAKNQRQKSKTESNIVKVKKEEPEEEFPPPLFRTWDCAVTMKIKKLLSALFFPSTPKEYLRPNTTTEKKSGVSKQKEPTLVISVMWPPGQPLYLTKVLQMVALGEKNENINQDQYVVDEGRGTPRVAHGILISTNPYNSGGGRVDSILEDFPKHVKLLATRQKSRARINAYTVHATLMNEAMEHAFEMFEIPEEVSEEGNVGKGGVEEGTTARGSRAVLLDHSSPERNLMGKKKQRRRADFLIMLDSQSGTDTALSESRMFAVFHRQARELLFPPKLEKNEEQVKKREKRSPPPCVVVFRTETPCIFAITKEAYKRFGFFDVNVESTFTCLEYLLRVYASSPFTSESSPRQRENSAEEQKSDESQNCHGIVNLGAKPIYNLLPTGIPAETQEYLFRKWNLFPESSLDLHHFLAAVSKSTPRGQSPASLSFSDSTTTFLFSTPFGNPKLSPSFFYEDPGLSSCILGNALFNDKTESTHQKMYQGCKVPTCAFELPSSVLPTFEGEDEGSSFVHQRRSNSMHCFWLQRLSVHLQSILVRHQERKQKTDGPEGEIVYVPSVVLPLHFDNFEKWESVLLSLHLSQDSKKNKKLQIGAILIIIDINGRQAPIPHVGQVAEQIQLLHEELTTLGYQFSFQNKHSGVVGIGAAWNSGAEAIFSSPLLTEWKKGQQPFVRSERTRKEQVGKQGEAGEGKYRSLCRWILFLTPNIVFTPLPHSSSLSLENILVETSHAMSYCTERSGTMPSKNLGDEKSEDGQDVGETTRGRGSGTGHPLLYFINGFHVFAMHESAYAEKLGAFEEVLWPKSKERVGLEYLLRLYALYLNEEDEERHTKRSKKSDVLRWRNKNPLVDFFPAADIDTIKETAARSAQHWVDQLLHFIWALSLIPQGAETMMDEVGETHASVPWDGMAQTLFTKALPVESNTAFKLSSAALKLNSNEYLYRKWGVNIEELQKCGGGGGGSGAGGCSVRSYLNKYLFSLPFHVDNFFYVPKEKEERSGRESGENERHSYYHHPLHRLSPEYFSLLFSTTTDKSELSHHEELRLCLREASQRAGGYQCMTRPKIAPSPSGWIPYCYINLHQKGQYLKALRAKYEKEEGIDDIKHTTKKAETKIIAKTDEHFHLLDAMIFVLKKNFLPKFIFESRRCYQDFDQLLRQPILSYRNDIDSAKNGRRRSENTKVFTFDNDRQFVKENENNPKKSSRVHFQFRQIGVIIPPPGSGEAASGRFGAEGFQCMHLVSQVFDFILQHLLLSEAEFYDDGGGGQEKWGDNNKDVDKDDGNPDDDDPFMFGNFLRLVVAFPTWTRSENIPQYHHQLDFEGKEGGVAAVGSFPTPSSSSSDILKAHHIPKDNENLIDKNNNQKRRRERGGGGDFFQSSASNSPFSEEIHHGTDKLFPLCHTSLMDMLNVLALAAEERGGDTQQGEIEDVGEAKRIKISFRYHDISAVMKKRETRRSSPNKNQQETKKQCHKEEEEKDAFMGGKRERRKRIHVTVLYYPSTVFQEEEKRDTTPSSAGPGVTGLWNTILQDDPCAIISSSSFSSSDAKRKEGRNDGEGEAMSTTKSGENIIKRTTTNNSEEGDVPELLSLILHGESLVFAQQHVNPHTQNENVILFAVKKLFQKLLRLTTKTTIEAEEEEELRQEQKKKEKSVALVATKNFEVFLMGYSTLRQIGFFNDQNVIHHSVTSDFEYMLRIMELQQEKQKKAEDLVSFSSSSNENDQRRNKKTKSSFCFYVSDNVSPALIFPSHLMKISSSASTLTHSASSVEYILHRHKVNVFRKFQKQKEEQEEEGRNFRRGRLHRYFSTTQKNILLQQADAVGIQQVEAAAIQQSNKKGRASAADSLNEIRRKSNDGKNENVRRSQNKKQKPTRHLQNLTFERSLNNIKEYVARGIQQWLIRGNPLHNNQTQNEKNQQHQKQEEGNVKDQQSEFRRRLGIHVPMFVVAPHLTDMGSRPDQFFNLLYAILRSERIFSVGKFIIFFPSTTSLIPTEEHALYLLKESQFLRDQEEKENFLVIYHSFKEYYNVTEDDDQIVDVMEARKRSRRALFKLPPKSPAETYNLIMRYALWKAKKMELANLNRGRNDEDYSPMFTFLLRPSLYIGTTFWIHSFFDEVVSRWQWRTKQVINITGDDDDGRKPKDGVPHQYLSMSDSITPTSSIWNPVLCLHGFAAFFMDVTGCASKIGEFDENIYPFEGEEEDYDIRINLLKLTKGDFSANFVEQVTAQRYQHRIGPGNKLLSHQGSVDEGGILDILQKEKTSAATNSLDEDKKSSSNFADQFTTTWTPMQQAKLQVYQGAYRFERSRWNKEEYFFRKWGFSPKKKPISFFTNDFYYSRFQYPFNNSKLGDGQVFDPEHRSCILGSRYGGGNKQNACRFQTCYFNYQKLTELGESSNNDTTEDEETEMDSIRRSLPSPVCHEVALSAAGIIDALGLNENNNMKSSTSQQKHKKTENEDDNERKLHHTENRGQRRRRGKSSIFVLHLSSLENAFPTLAEDTYKEFLLNQFSHRGRRRHPEEDGAMEEEGSGMLDAMIIVFTEESYQFLHAIKEEIFHQRRQYKNEKRKEEEDDVPFFLIGAEKWQHFVVETMEKMAMMKKTVHDGDPQEGEGTVIIADGMVQWEVGAFAEYVELSKKLTTTKNYFDAATNSHQENGREDDVKVQGFVALFDQQPFLHEGRRGRETEKEWRRLRRSNYYEKQQRKNGNWREVQERHHAIRPPLLVAFSFRAFRFVYHSYFLPQEFRGEGGEGENGNPTSNSRFLLAKRNHYFLSWPLMVESPVFLGPEPLGYFNFPMRFTIQNEEIGRVSIALPSISAMSTKVEKDQQESVFMKQYENLLQNDMRFALEHQPSASLEAGHEEFFLYPQLGSMFSRPSSLNSADSDDVQQREFEENGRLSIGIFLPLFRFAGGAVIRNNPSQKEESRKLHEVNLQGIEQLKRMLSNIAQSTAGSSRRTSYQTEGKENDLDDDDDDEEVNNVNGSNGVGYFDKLYILIQQVNIVSTYSTTSADESSVINLPFELREILTQLHHSFYSSLSGEEGGSSIHLEIRIETISQANAHEGGLNPASGWNKLLRMYSDAHLLKKNKLRKTSAQAEESAKRKRMRSEKEMMMVGSQDRIMLLVATGSAKDRVIPSATTIRHVAYSVHIQNDHGEKEKYSRSRRLPSVITWQQAAVSWIMSPSLVDASMGLHFYFDENILTCQHHLHPRCNVKNNFELLTLEYALRMLEKNQQLIMRTQEETAEQKNGGEKKKNNKNTFSLLSFQKQFSVLGWYSLQEDIDEDGATSQLPDFICSLSTQQYLKDKFSSFLLEKIVLRQGEKDQWDNPPVSIPQPSSSSSWSSLDELEATLRITKKAAADLASCNVSKDTTPRNLMDDRHHSHHLRSCLRVLSSFYFRSQNDDHDDDEEEGERKNNKKGWERYRHRIQKMDQFHFPTCSSLPSQQGGNIDDIDANGDSLSILPSLSELLFRLFSSAKNVTDTGGDAGKSRITLSLVLTHEDIRYLHTKIVDQDDETDISDAQKLQQSQKLTDWLLLYLRVFLHAVSNQMLAQKHDQQVEVVVNRILIVMPPFISKTENSKLFDPKYFSTFVYRELQIALFRLLRKSPDDGQEERNRENEEDEKKKNMFNISSEEMQSYLTILSAGDDDRSATTTSTGASLRQREVHVWNEAVKLSFSASLGKEKYVQEGRSSKTKDEKFSTRSTSSSSLFTLWFHLSTLTDHLTSSPFSFAFSSLESSTFLNSQVHALLSQLFMDLASTQKVNENENKKNKNKKANDDDDSNRKVLMSQQKQQRPYIGFSPLCPLNNLVRKVDGQGEVEEVIRPHKKSSNIIIESQIPIMMLMNKDAYQILGGVTSLTSSPSSFDADETEQEDKQEYTSVIEVFLNYRMKSYQLFKNAQQVKRKTASSTSGSPLVQHDSSVDRGKYYLDVHVWSSSFFSTSLISDVFSWELKKQNATASGRDDDGMVKIKNRIRRQRKVEAESQCLITEYRLLTGGGKIPPPMVPPRHRFIKIFQQRWGIDLTSVSLTRLDGKSNVLLLSQEEGRNADDDFNRVEELNTDRQQHSSILSSRHGLWWLALTRLQPETTWFAGPLSQWPAAVGEEEEVDVVPEDPFLWEVEKRLRQVLLPPSKLQRKLQEIENWRTTAEKESTTKIKRKTKVNNDVNKQDDDLLPQQPAAEEGVVLDFIPVFGVLTVSSDFDAFQVLVQSLDCPIGEMVIVLNSWNTILHRKLLAMQGRIHEYFREKEMKKEEQEREGDATKRSTSQEEKEKGETTSSSSKNRGKKSGPLHIIYAPENKGVSGGWNTILRTGFTQSKYLHWALVVNADYIFSPKLLILLAEEVHQLLRMQSPRAERSDGKKTEAEVKIGTLNLQGKFACFIMPRDCFENVGPFDEGIWPAYAEDVEYLVRMKAMGYEAMKLKLTFNASAASSSTSSLEKNLSINDREDQTTPPLVVHREIIHQQSLSTKKNPHFVEILSHWGREDYILQRWGYDMFASWVPTGDVVPIGHQDIPFSKPFFPPLDGGDHPLLPRNDVVHPNEKEERIIITSVVDQKQRQCVETGEGRKDPCFHFTCSFQAAPSGYPSIQDPQQLVEDEETRLCPIDQMVVHNIQQLLIAGLKREIQSKHEKNRDNHQRGDGQENSSVKLYIPTLALVVKEQVARTHLRSFLLALNVPITQLVIIVNSVNRDLHRLLMKLEEINNNIFSIFFNSSKVENKQQQEEGGGLQQLLAKKKKVVFIETYPQNVGLAAAWNRAISLHQTLLHGDNHHNNWILFSNVDVRFGRDALHDAVGSVHQYIALKKERNEEKNGENNNSERVILAHPQFGFAFFATILDWEQKDNKKEEDGESWFDEKLWPSGGEDLDFVIKTKISSHQKRIDAPSSFSTLLHHHYVLDFFNLQKKKERQRQKWKEEKEKGEENENTFYWSFFNHTVPFDASSDFIPLQAEHISRWNPLWYLHQKYLQIFGVNIQFSKKRRGSSTSSSLMSFYLQMNTRRKEEEEEEVEHEEVDPNKRSRSYQQVQGVSTFPQVSSNIGDGFFRQSIQPALDAIEVREVENRRSIHNKNSKGRGGGKAMMKKMSQGFQNCVANGVGAMTHCPPNLFLRRRPDDHEKDDKNRRTLTQQRRRESASSSSSGLVYAYEFCSYYPEEKGKVRMIGSGRSNSQQAAVVFEMHADLLDFCNNGE